LVLPDLGHQIPAPSWLDPIDSKNRGLDLLGLRLPVQSIGNSMMNGITTITPAVRYFSLRSWLIWSYVRARRSDDWTEFRDYAAKAEACIAIGNILAETDALGLVGPEEARKILEKGESTIQLKPLVGQLATQIYANPSEELGLSFTGDSDIPGLTEERGVVLAKLIDESLRVSVIGKRLSEGETINSARRDELVEFGSFVALNKFLEDEAELLADAIIPHEPRESEISRLSTYTLILALSDRLARVPSEPDFFEEICTASSELPDSLLSCRNGWQRYLVRDSLAVCHEATLASVVSGITHLQSGPSSTVLRNDVLRWVVEQSCGEQAVLKNLGLELPASPITNWTINEVVELIEKATSGSSFDEQLIPRWPGALHEWHIEGLVRSAGVGAPVLLPIVWLLARRRAAKEIDAQIPEAQYAYRSGFGRIGLNEVVFPELDRFVAERWRYVDVVEAIVQRTVDQHLRIAWSRLRSEHPPRDVAVLTSDGQRWCYRKSFGGGRTASRLGQAFSWLNQLGLLDASGITEAGKEVLDRSLRACEATQ
jgi:hypothetical protein